METTVIKRDKKFRKQNTIISFLGFLCFLIAAVAIKNDAPLLTVVFGIVSGLYLFSFIKDRRAAANERAEMTFTDTGLSFADAGAFTWNDINAVEVYRMQSSNEYNERSTSTHLRILLANKTSFSFRIDLLEKKESEILALFERYKPEVRIG